MCPLGIDYKLGDNNYNSLVEFSKRQFGYIFYSDFFILVKKSIDISCKLFPNEKMCRKCQSLFSKGNNKTEAIYLFLNKIKLN